MSEAMGRPIRVAQIIGKAINGGTESFAMNYYTHIDRSKIQFDFFVESTSKIIDKEKIESLGGKVVIIPSYTHVFAYIKTLKRLFKDGNYDIVHSNMNALSVFALCAAKKAGVKVRIAHSHSTTNKKEHLRNFIKNILRLFSKKYATHYFACSELAGRWLFGDKTFNKGEVTVINNAIELEKYKFNEQTRDSLRAKYGLTNQFVIGHIGRFMSQKNHTFLIDIFNEVQKRRSDARLLLIGDGPLYDEIVNKVHTLNLDDKVIFTGVKQNAYDYYNVMDVFVLPSLYEGLPVVGVEAQANGLPIVTSDTVTRDLNIAGGVDYLSLGETASFWANHIVHLDTQIDRGKYFYKIKNSAFDIKSEAKKLEDKYIMILAI